MDEEFPLKTSHCHPRNSGRRIPVIRRNFACLGAICLERG
jgi:hypothetical protein